MAANEKQLIAGKWIHEPQEQEGNDYWFDGRTLTTNGVSADIPDEELRSIIIYLQELAKVKNGLDYLQVFKKEDGDKIYVIDQITKAQVKEYPEHHYCTILYPSEY